MAVWIMVHKAPTHQLLTRFMDGDAFTRNLFEIIVEELYEAAVEVPMLHLMANLEKQSDDVLNHLAWQFHVDFYDAKFERHKKIALIRTAFEVHKYKGTPYALEKVLEAVGLPGEVLEWFDTEKEPYTFRIELDNTKIDEGILQMLKQMIHHYKNTRSGLEDIFIRFKSLSLHLTPLQYHYPVYYPISGYHWTEGTPGLALENTMRIASDIFAYPIYYPTALQAVPGAPSQAQATLQSHAAAQTNPYPVCGMFYGGGF